jgi:hypothetical protein
MTILHLILILQIINLLFTASVYFNTLRDKDDRR